MGNYRFKFSDMIPNAWFYKFKHTSKSRKQNTTRRTNEKHQHASSSSSSSLSTSSSGSSWSAAPAPSPKTRHPHLSQQRKSYYFTRDRSTPPPPHDHEHMIYDHAATDTRSSNASNSEPPSSSSKKKRIPRRNRPSSICTKRSTPGRVVSSSVSAGCSCRSTIESVWTKPDSTPEDYPNSPLDSSSSENEHLVPPEFCSSRVASVSNSETLEGMLSGSASCRCRADNDIIIDTKNKTLNSNLDDEVPNSKLDGFDTVSELDLPPIITKPSKFCGTTKEMTKENHQPTRHRSSSVKFEERNEYGSLSVKVVKEDGILNSSPNFSKAQKTTNSPARRFLVNSPGVKLRTNSPRIASKKIQAGRKSLSSSRRRRSVSESFAVVKSSEDPQRDFRESMMEMIVENNICASKDLEDLLACYLSLNSDEYHDLIIRVFKQIWFDIVDVVPN